MNREQEKTLAIMQQEQEQYCIVYIGDDTEYVIDTNKAQEDIENEWNIQYEGDEENQLPFEEWLLSKYEQIEIEEYDIDDYNNKWLVCTDKEADDKWEEELERYIEECVLPMLPEQYKNYFDSDSFICDCKMDGRGHSLAKYDGREHEQIVNGTTYYLYRIN